MAKKNCYIYTRVSTAAQIEGYSLEAQQERLHQFADYKGFRIVGEYCDAGKSGKSIKGRPEFLKMLDDISSEKDDISAILVFKLSRFGRNAADILKSIQLLQDYDIDLICVEDGIDSSTAGGRLTLTILSAVAEIERENINVQFMAGRIQKIMNGGWPGGPVPFGYRNIDKNIVVHQEEASIIKLIYEKYLLPEMSVNGVAIWLNENGYKRIVKGEERPFTADYIKSALDNPFYMGKIMYNRRTNLKGTAVKPKEEICVDGIHEAIIDEAQWNAVQSKRKENAIIHKKDNEDRISLLSGLVKCPCCNNGMIATKNKRVNKNRGGYYKTIYYYSCRYYRKSAGRTCNFKHTYNQEKVDNAIYEIVSRLTTNPMFEKILKDASGDAMPIEELQLKEKEVRKQIHHLEHEKNRLGTELDNLDIFADDYDQIYENIQEQIDAVYDEIDSLEYRIKRIRRKLNAAEEDAKSVDNVKVILNNFAKFYDKMSDEEKRELYRHFIEKIEVYPEEQADGRIIRNIYFKFPISVDARKTEAVKTGSEEDAISFVLNCDELQVTAAEAKATYTEIKDYIINKYGFKVSTLYIAQIKRKYGVSIGKAYNKPEKNTRPAPICPKEKELAILDALKYFRMVESDVEYKEADS